MTFLYKLSNPSKAFDEILGKLWCFFYFPQQRTMSTNYILMSNFAKKQTANNLFLFVNKVNRIFNKTTAYLIAT